MGKKGGGSNEAAMARADEQERQDRIRQGTAKINEIFNGRTIGDGLLGSDAVYDPTKTYYTADGQRWTPPSASPSTSLWGQPGVTGANTASEAAANATFNNASGAAHQINNGQSAYSNLQLAPEMQNAEKPAAPSIADMFKQALGNGLYSGTKQTAGFNDDFFGKQKQAFIDYATPQLEDQYADAQKQLTYALSRSGLLDSSVRAEKTAELQKKYDLNKQQIADQALSYETEARNNVEKARSDLITMLNATGDAEGAANSALARSQALSQPQAFSPLTQLFGDFTSALGTQAAIEKANAMSSAYGGPQYGRYNTGLFSNTKSVKVS